MTKRKTDKKPVKVIKARMGRPPKEIDKTQFEKLCALQPTLEEVAGFFDCDLDTVNAWCKRVYNATFSEVLKSKSAAGKMSLRRTQFKLAEKSAAMAIFLGKNYLGQTDGVKEFDADRLPDDGFIKALEGSAAEDWENDEESSDISV